MVRLLISVRSVAEASICVHNGADIIDIKEPARGSLGMSSPETIGAIAREVPPRFPVGAALGEWMEWRRGNRFPRLPPGLSYLKIGLSGAGAVEGWREEFGRFCHELCSLAEVDPCPSWVAVAYADWKEAQSPPPEEVLDFAVANGFSVFLLDTWSKNGSSLFDHLGAETIARYAAAARIHGLEVVLAGSIRREEMGRALALEPDGVAIRSAVCHASYYNGEDREGIIDAEAVRSLADLLSPACHALA